MDAERTHETAAYLPAEDRAGYYVPATPTAAKNLLGKAVWKATFTASETDRQNHHHRPRPHGSLLLFFFTDH